MQYINGVPSYILDQFYSPGILLVSGSGPNAWGHAILRLSKLGPYAHVHKPYDYPDFMDSIDEYLKTENKIIWDEIDIKVPNMDAAKQELDRVAQLKWFWKAVTDNCVSFAVQVLNAGGANIPNNLSNLPNKVLSQVLNGISPNMKVDYSIQSEKGFSSYIGNDDL